MLCIVYARKASIATSARDSAFSERYAPQGNVYRYVMKPRVGRVNGDPTSSVVREVPAPTKLV